MVPLQSPNRLTTSSLTVPPSERLAPGDGLFGREENLSLLKEIGTALSGNRRVVRSKVKQLFETAKSQLDYDRLLPCSLPLLGKPMDVINKRPMFRPLFQRVMQARKVLFKCGRQLGKTASEAAALVMHMAMRDNFRMAYVVPLALYASRLHTNYMAPMIQGNYFPWPLIDKNCTANVNTKTFTNGSRFDAISCFNSPRAALGATEDSIMFDEIQDMNIEFLPQILETIGSSEYRWEFYLGTARSVANTIHQLWESSSQNIWWMRCDTCKKESAFVDPEMSLRMIQRSGICCSFCAPSKQRLLNLLRGVWRPQYPERQAEFAGYHVPQTIVTARVEPHERYIDTIYNKLHGLRKYNEARFLEEVLGISTDMDGRPLTAQQIQKASELDFTDDRQPKLEEYDFLSGGVDWGGAERISFTVGTVVGWHSATSVFHCLSATRPLGIPEHERYLPIAGFMKRIGKGRLVGMGGDGVFVGPVQNPNLARAVGVRCGSIVYVTQKRFYTATGGKANFFSVDRSTLIFITTLLIIQGKILFPKGSEFQIFTEDLKNFIAEDIETHNGVIRRYTRIPGKADDFLHALGYAIFTASIMSGNLDLPSMVGLESGTSVNARFSDIIGDS